MQIKRIFLMVLGLTATIVGWGMWKEPYLNFDILVSLIVEEIIRLSTDPFAILGLMIMMLGLWVFFKAIFEDEDAKKFFSFGKSQDEF